MKIKNWKMISYTTILMLICICSFLVAKYIVRSSIGNEEIPVDTSTRM